ncbi:MAG: nicotinate-nucleotide adenylyltransferase [Rhodocyclaceae bacterium]|nr:nicotinate-nucleotide adenylyltransferase [Rhodocyclaceae bacterium]
MDRPEPSAQGILGGTFDPVHYGHLRLAEEALQALGLGAVRWIPAGRPPHRGDPLVTADERLEMVRRAIAGNAAFQLDEAEVRAEAPSYTVTTLERLRRELGAVQPLVLLMGADAFLGLATWRRWQELFDLAHIAVATRPGHELDIAAMPEPLAREFRVRGGTRDDLGSSPAGRVCSFAITPLDISATDIRETLGEGRSPRYLLPDPVLAYIQQHGLYCRSATHGS